MRLLLGLQISSAVCCELLLLGRLQRYVISVRFPNAGREIASCLLQAIHYWKHRSYAFHFPALGQRVVERESTDSFREQPCLMTVPASFYRTLRLHYLTGLLWHDGCDLRHLHRRRSRPPLHSLRFFRIRLGHVSMVSSLAPAGHDSNGRLSGVAEIVSPPYDPCLWTTARFHDRSTSSLSLLSLCFP